MKQIDKLTYEKAIEIFRYSAETGVLERKLKNGDWRVCGNKPTHSAGYGYVSVGGKMYLTHRLAWLLVHGEWPGFVDHRNRDRMDNRIENLRVATPSENSHNHKMHRDNSTGFTGVYFHKQANKYVAQILLNCKRIYLGLYATAEEAHTAYMVAKIQHHPSSPDARAYLKELTLAG